MSRTIITFVLLLMGGWLQPSWAQLSSELVRSSDGPIPPNTFYSLQGSYLYSDFKASVDQWKKAKAQGYPMDEEGAYGVVIGKACVLEDCRWKFYQYGQANYNALSPEEKILWTYARDRETGRQEPPKPEELERLTPDQLLENIRLECAYIQDVLKNGSHAGPPPVIKAFPAPSNKTSSRSGASLPAPSPTGFSSAAWPVTSGVPGWRRCSRVSSGMCCRPWGDNAGSNRRGWGTGCRIARRWRRRLVGRRKRTFFGRD